MEERTIKKAIVINAQTEDVWKALTDPEFTSKYMFGCTLLCSWKVGEPFVYKGNKDGKEYTRSRGQLLNFIPEKLLQFSSYSPSSSVKDIPSNYTTVTFELVAETDGVTTLRVTQGDFASVEEGERSYSESEMDWDYSLNALKSYLESSYILPFQSES